MSPSVLFQRGRSALMYRRTTTPGNELIDWHVTGGPVKAWAQVKPDGRPGQTS